MTLQRSTVSRDAEGKLSTSSLVKESITIENHNLTERKLPLPLPLPLPIRAHLLILVSLAPYPFDIALAVGWRRRSVQIWETAA
jgi:hypothetical protein